MLLNILKINSKLIVEKICDMDLKIKSKRNIYTIKK